MRSVLGHLWRYAAVFIFCTVVLPPVGLPGPMSIGAGVAWADYDDHDDHDDHDDDDNDNDDDDDDDDRSGGSSSSGSSSGLTGIRSAGTGRSGGASGGAKVGAASGVGSSSPAVAIPADTLPSESELDLALRPAPEIPLHPNDAWKALNADERLVSVQAGGWNRPYRAHAVRGDMLALNVGPAEIRELEQGGFRLLDQTRLGALGVVASRFGLPAGRDIGSALRQARSRAPGAIIAPNYIYLSAGHATLNECDDAGCYGPTLVGWEQVADTCGTGIRIGMTDTGIDRDHPALHERMVRTNIFDPYGEGSVPDHGTAVAGLLVGNAETGFPGMLPGAELFAADVFHTNEAGDSYSTLLSLVQGLDWLVGNGVSVVNVSMTGPPNALLEDTVNRMNGRGVVVVAAAGNGGPSALPAYPAAYHEVISVTAVDRDLRPYSMANRGAYISFSSPGVGIWSAGASGSGRHRTGTSFAAAHASAIIADMIRQDGPTGVHDAIRALQDTARDLGAPGRDPVFGWGLIQGNSACRA